MKRWICLLLSLTAWGQAPVFIQFGHVDCGAIQVPTSQVQSWCYSWPGPPWVLTENQIGALPFNLTYTVPSGDSITWAFDAAGNYRFTTDQSVNITSGIFGGTPTATPTEILSLACPTGLEPGGSGPCLLILNQAVLTPFNIALGIPGPLVGPSVISVLAGQSTVTFTVQYPAPTGTPVVVNGGRLFPLSLNVAAIDLRWPQ